MSREPGPPACTITAVQAGVLAGPVVQVTVVLPFRAPVAVGAVTLEGMPRSRPFSGRRAG